MIPWLRKLGSAEVVHYIVHVTWIECSFKTVMFFLFTIFSISCGSHTKYSGSIIKHQLISSLTLGVALRAVLDSLRKPSDSKVWILLRVISVPQAFYCKISDIGPWFMQMYLFGTIALEQFVNDIELRQYCSHILLISHLRSTHPDLVAVVEQTLSRISSGQLESDASVPQAGSSQFFPGSGEVINFDYMFLLCLCYSTFSRLSIS